MELYDPKAPKTGKTTATATATAEPAKELSAEELHAAAVHAAICKTAEDDGLVVLDVISTPAIPDVALGILTELKSFEALIESELEARYRKTPRTVEESDEANAKLGSLEFTLVYHTADREVQKLVLPLRDASVLGAVMPSIENAMASAAMKARLTPPPKETK